MDSSSSIKLLDPKIYTVAWIAPLQIEAQAALHMLDTRHQGRFPVSRGDDYVYRAGEIRGHNVVIATLPAGQTYGTGSAAALASQLKRFFPNLWFGLLVGVAAGLPDLSGNSPRDIRLGDVLVGLAEGDSAGLAAYDLGKETEQGFQTLRYGHVLAIAEPVIRSAIGNIRMDAPNDALVLLPFYETFRDKEHTTGNFDDPGQHHDVLYDESVDGTAQPIERIPRAPSKRTRIWYGPIASGGKLLKNAQKRIELRDKYGVIGLEMEEAGAMNRIPVSVIRGVCDYGDRQKNKKWQPYAAAMAASYAKAILDQIPPARSDAALRLTDGPDHGDQKRRRSHAGLGAGSIDEAPSHQIPFVYIPIPHNRYFTGRADILDDLEHRLINRSKSSIFVISGMSGVGKTQVAAEFSYRVRDRYPYYSIFWTSAHSRDDLFRSYDQIAQKLGLQHSEIEDSTKLVLQYLSSPSAGEWLLVVDSADHISTVLESLPRSKQGLVLVTTSEEEWTEPSDGQQKLLFFQEKQGNYGQAEKLYQRTLGLGPPYAGTVRGADPFAALSNSPEKAAEDEQLKTSMLTSSDIETLHNHESVKESSSFTLLSSYQTSVSEEHMFIQKASTSPTTISNDLPAAFVHDPQKPPVESDVESLPSDKDDIQSQNSRHTTPRETGSKRLLGEALVEEEQFKELCDEALRKMDGHRFVENIRRLLKLLYKNLSFEAQSGPQKATVGLLQSRRGRYRIGQHVYALLQQDTEAPIKTDPEEKQSIENWLRTTYPSTEQEEEAGFVWAAGPEKLDDNPDFGSDDDSVQGSEHDIHEPFPAISDLSSFLRESKAFRVLLEHFTSLFVPFELGELVQSVPRDQIEFSYEQDFSPINQFKLWMEDSTGSPWNWWPFTQPKRVLQEDEVRVLWRCNCGKMSWDEILVNQARWMKKLQALSDSTAPSPCWCPIKESRSGIALKNLPQLQSLSGATTSNSPQAVDDAQKSPNRAPVPSATAGKLTPSQLKPDYPEISSTESEMMEQGRLCSIERHWVLLGVQGSRPTRIPGEVAVETSTTDYHFFKSLKAEYAKHRGRIRLWFSLWQLEYFEFAEFQRLTPKRMVLERSGLPPQPGEYDYIRRHTGNDLQILPVSRHVFKSFLESCSDPCRLSWFFPHDCDTFKGGDSNLKRIPKRNRSFINDETTEIWGLSTIYHLSCVHIITYHLIMVGGPMAFFAWWVITFPGDLQNASVPVTIALGFLSLFWGILVSFKDVS